MAYNSVHVLSNVYNHYMTTYAPKSSSPYDSHKKSELRNIYNTIVKMNKEAPLCILDTSKDAQKFAVDMKENARDLRNTIASLGGLDEEELLNKKVAYSSNENIVSAKYIGSDESTETDTYNIEVKHLASPQVNMGTFLPADEAVRLSPDTYSFDVAIDDLNYEFQFSIRSGDTNREVQDRLARLINNAKIGMSASVEADDSGSSYLRIESDSTGLKNGKPLLFHVTDDKTSKASGAVNYFGLDYTSSMPSDASFVVNGKEFTTNSNHFTLEHAYELQLNGVSSEDGETASVGLKTDVESLAENINTLVRGYNSFLQAVAKYTGSQPKSNRLLTEMSGTARVYSHDLTSVGLHLNQDGSLTVNNDLLRQAAMSDDAKDTFSTMKGFTNSILRKTNQVSLDPMNYVNNIIVAYKNPGRNYATPYITSAYSGMMFNSYC